MTLLRVTNNNTNTILIVLIGRIVIRKVRKVTRIVRIVTRMVGTVIG